MIGKKHTLLLIFVELKQFFLNGDRLVRRTELRMRINHFNKNLEGITYPKKPP
jgi:hypothetical protein